MYRIYITADFDSHDEAVKALADAEEAIGKNNGDLQHTEIEDLEEGS
jgi:hypothetical protein